MPILAGNAGRADDFIYRTEAQSDRSDDQGRIPKLEEDGRLHSDFTIPTGIVVEYEGDPSDIPDGFLLCDGSAVSRTTYSALFSKIGTRHGAGNGTTTFNLPDRRGRVAAGYDSSQTEFNSLPKTGGAKSISIEHTHAGPTHTHGFSGTTDQADSDSAVTSGGSNSRTTLSHKHTFSGNTGSSGSGNTGNMSANSSPSILQPYITTLFIIKI